jgi:site-specific DNA-methyltransferase (adenine-specific)
MSTYKLINGDCIEEMKKMLDNSIDSIVTDPPYEIGFMGKGWDNTGIAYNKKMWAEALRVLKPGGHMLAFSSTRTYHRMVCAIEDSGFEIRDQLAWIYGSGFPKSQNVGKMIDKKKGKAEDAKKYQGYGTALKPAQEPIVLARKPLSEKTVAANVIKHGTGAINIDGCRVATGTNDIPSTGNRTATFGTQETISGGDGSGGYIANDKGRWPANIIHDGSEEVLHLFPDSNGSGGSVPNVKITGYGDGIGTGKAEYFGGERTKVNSGSGSAARFFYCAKANKQDRSNGNNHPTIKPTMLMQYLIKLITPVGGTVLDPFNGSGSTGKAAMLLQQYNYIGIDLSAEYIKISKARIIDALLQNKEQT